MMAVDTQGICELGWALDQVVQYEQGRNADGSCFGTPIPGGGGVRADQDADATLNRLASGSHVITAFAAGPNGVVARQLLYFGVDNIWPTVSVSEPAPGWHSGTETVTASGATSGPSGIASISCDGTPHPGASAQLTFTGTGDFKGTCQSVNGASVPSTAASYDVLLDNTPPTGVWRPVQYMSDPRYIVVDVGDADSGVAGGQVSLRWPDGSLHPIPTTFNPSAGTLTGFVDDDVLPAGLYAAVATVTDAVGNQATVTTQADGSPLYIPIPLRTPAAVQIGTTTALRRSCDVKRVRVAPSPVRVRGARRPRSRVVRVCVQIPVPSGGNQLRLAGDETGTINGMVETESGQPLPGAPVQITEQPDGWAAQPVGTITSDATGRFQYQVPAGPSRTITLTFPGTATLHDARTTASIVSRGAGTLTIDKRMRAGRRLHLAGQVAGLIPASGVLVQLQYWLVGHSRAWAPFGKPVKTGPDGRWSTTIAVSKGAAGSTYRIDALIPAQNGWPYLTATTPTLVRRATR